MAATLNAPGIAPAECAPHRGFRFLSSGLRGWRSKRTAHYDFAVDDETAIDCAAGHRDGLRDRFGHFAGLTHGGTFRIHRLMMRRLGLAEMTDGPLHLRYRLHGNRPIWHIANV